MSESGIDGTEDLTRRSAQLRRTILDTIVRTAGPHVGSCLSCAEILATLYFRTLRVEPGPVLETRDRFIFSKGHAAVALYSVLYERGFISKEAFDRYSVCGGPTEWHPNRDVESGVELSTGSLGHGLSVGAGMALAARCDGGPQKVYVLLSDGELNEGSTWEAILFAGHHGLDNLVAIVDYNKMQALECVGLDPLSEKFASFGWGCAVVDGHSTRELAAAFDRVPVASGKPSVVIARTTKGKGVSFMENNLKWHYACPAPAEYEQALAEVDRGACGPV